MQVLFRDLLSNLAGIADYEKKLGSDAEETPQPLMSSQRIPTMKDTQMDSLFTAVPARDSERLCCTKCRFSTRDTVLFARHVSHHDEMTFCCSLCSHVSYSKTESDRHLVFHTGLFPFSCSLCNYGAVRRDYVLKHIKRIHKMPTSESRSMAARVVQASKPPASAAKQQISSEAGTAPRLPRVQVRLSTSSSLHRTLQADSSAIRPLPAAHSSSPASVQVELLAPLQQPLQHNSPLTVSCPERLQIPAGCVLELVQVKAVNGTQELELRVIPAAGDTGKASTTVAEAEPVPSQETSLCLTEKSSIAGESGHGNKPGNRRTLTLPTSTRHSDVLPVISSVYSLCPALTTRSQQHNVTSTRSQLHNTSPRSRLHNTSIRSLLKNNTTTYSQLRKNTMAHSQLLKRTSTQSQLHNSPTKHSQIQNNRTTQSQIQNNRTTQSQLHNSTSTQSQLHNSTSTQSQLHNSQSKHSQLQNNPPTQSQLHNNTSTRSQSNNNNSSTHSQLPNDTTTHSQLLNSTTTHPQLLNNTTTHSFLENKRTTLFQLVNKAATHSQPNNTGSCSQLNSIQTLSKNSQIQNNTTAYSRLLYSQTTHLQLHDTTTHSQPQNSTATYSQPQINTITRLQPKNNKTAHSQTQDNTTTPLWHQNNTSAHPQDNKATHSQPQNSTPAHSQPQNNTTKYPQPKNNKTTHSQPQKNTTTHLQPNNNTATHSEPQMNTIAHLQPQNDTTTLSQPQTNTTTHSWTQGKTYRAEIKTEAEEQTVSLSCSMPDIKAEMADDNSPTTLLTSLGTSVNCPHLSPRVSIARLLVPELEKKATKEILSQKPSPRLSVKRKACENLPERVGLPESENMTASEELCKPESLKRRHNETYEVNKGTKQSCGLKVPPLKLALLKSTSLKLVPLRADQLVQAPSRDQPVVVLNHPSPASRRMGVRMKLKKVQGKTYRVMQLLLDV